MWLAKSAIVLAVIVAVVYLAITVAMYFGQGRLIFPTGMVAPAPVMPPAAETLEIATPDGARLRGTRLPPMRPAAVGHTIVLGFPGNAWNADAYALYLRDLYPHAEIVVFHYRGYAPSTGEPGAAALLDDALAVYDRVRSTAETAHIVVVGVSLGSGVAAWLASRRPVDGLVLVSPFDSMAALAGGRYPWLPVRVLLRHHIKTTDYVARVAAPTALIAAGHDTIVPPERTVAVRAAIGHLVLDRTIEAADHIDLYNHPGFRSAMTDAMAAILRDWRTPDAAAGGDRK